MSGFINWITVVVPGWFSDTFSILRATFKFRDIIDILVVALIIYMIVSLLRQTRASQLLRGIAVLMLAYFVARILDLKTVNFMIELVLQFGLIAIVVIFQPEIRRGLEQVGRSKMLVNLFRGQMSTELRDQWRSALVTISDSAESLARKRCGALIVIENFSRLSEIESTGTKIDASPTAELIETIFYEGSPLHDGAVIVKNARISAAGCLLPVSQNTEISKDLGTRHRAAIGLSEISDALIVVVSEETGRISLAQNGIIIQRLDRANLYRILETNLIPKEDEESERTKSFLDKVFRR